MKYASYYSYFFQEEFYKNTSLRFCRKLRTNEEQLQSEIIVLKTKNNV